jgi:hypothetical protein
MGTQGCGLKILYPLLPVHQPDEVFLEQKHRNVNLQPSHRPPFPVSDRGGLID